MPTPTCSKCRRVIPSEDINVAQDVAYCRECNLSYRLSELTFGGDVGANIDVNRPPAGAWYQSDGGGTVIGATNRSLGTAFGMLFFALFWNGIVSVFVVIATIGTLHYLHVQPPDWFPNPKMEGGGEMSLGMTLFFWLFLAPFIMVGASVAGICLVAFFGHTEVRIENTRGMVFIGIGPLGWKRRFDASQVRDVRIYEKRNSDSANTIGLLIETREGKQLKLGSMLTNERRQFLLTALRRSLIR